MLLRVVWTVTWVNNVVCLSLQRVTNALRFVWSEFIQISPGHGVFLPADASALTYFHLSMNSLVIVGYIYLKRKAMSLTLFRSGKRSSKIRQIKQLKN